MLESWYPDGKPFGGNSTNSFAMNNLLSYLVLTYIHEMQDLRFGIIKRGY